MNTLTYKGFSGSVNFSAEDNAFFGKIEGIDGLVNFEGSSVKELTDSFHEAVDDYIDYCKRNGIEAHKSYTGYIRLHVSPDVHSRVAALAKRTGVSINTFVSNALDSQIAKLQP